MIVLINCSLLFFKNSFVKSYQSANAFSPKPDRDRYLLLNKNEILKIATLCESVSTHPIANAILKEGYVVDSSIYTITEIAGKGMKVLSKKELVEQIVNHELQQFDNVKMILSGMSDFEQMKENIAKALSVDVKQINIKATTEEGLGFTGEGLGISSQSICLLETVDNFDYRSNYNVEENVGQCTGCQGCPMKNEK